MLLFAVLVPVAPYPGPFSCHVSRPLLMPCFQALTHAMFPGWKHVIKFCCLNKNVSFRHGERLGEATGRGAFERGACVSDCMGGMCN